MYIRCLTIGFVCILQLREMIYVLISYLHMIDMEDYLIQNSAHPVSTHDADQHL